MAENQTRETAASVEDYLDRIGDAERRQDCRDLIALMSKVSRHKPKMWGPSIVGFGSYHYVYESGREGDMCLVGFSSRKGDISVYGMVHFKGQPELLAELGKHKTKGGCVYIRTFSDINRKVLEKLVAGSIAEVRRRHKS